MPPKRSSGCKGNDWRSSCARVVKSSSTAFMLMTNFLRSRPLAPYTALIHVSRAKRMLRTGSPTPRDVCIDASQLDLHVQCCSSLRRAREAGKSTGDILVANVLWQSHQGRHLPVQNIYCPPNLATSLHKWLTKISDRHVGMHTLSQSYTHSLAYCDMCCIARIQCLQV